MVTIAIPTPSASDKDEGVREAWSFLPEKKSKRKVMYGHDHHHPFHLIEKQRKGHGLDHFSCLRSGYLTLFPRRGDGQGI